MSPLAQELSPVLAAEPKFVSMPSRAEKSEKHELWSLILKGDRRDEDEQRISSSWIIGKGSEISVIRSLDGDNVVKLSCNPPRKYEAVKRKNSSRLEHSNFTVMPYKTWILNSDRQDEDKQHISYSSFMRNSSEISVIQSLDGDNAVKLSCNPPRKYDAVKTRISWQLKHSNFTLEVANKGNDKKEDTSVGSAMAPNEMSSSSLAPNEMSSSSLAPPQRKKARTCESANGCGRPLCDACYPPGGLRKCR